LTRIKQTQIFKKSPEPQMKQENPRSSEKSPAVAILIVIVCATKKCASVTLCTRTSSRKMRKQSLLWC